LHDSGQFEILGGLESPALAIVRRATRPAATIARTTPRVALVHLLAILHIIRITRGVSLATAAVTRPALSVTILIPVLLTILSTPHAHTLTVILTVIVPGTWPITPAWPAAATGAIAGVIPGTTIIIAAAAGTHAHTGYR
jgi:hypothetical protein